MASFCVAVGIGLTAAMLGLLDLLLFRPPAHVEDAASIRRVYIKDSFPGFGEFTSSTTSYRVARDLENAGAFSAVGGLATTDVAVGRGEQARRVRAAFATPSYLALLEVRPALGRLFTAAEGLPGRGARVALLSNELWRSGFGSSREVLGRTVQVGEESLAIIGVLPPGFSGLDLDAVGLWVPISMAGPYFGDRWAESRGTKFLEIAVRLHPGVSEAAAMDQATAVFRAGSAQDGAPKPKAGIVLGPVQSARGPNRSDSVRLAAWLAGVSAIVLVIACANVANLLLVRGLRRRRELALRLALGATRVRVFRLVLFEALLIVALGALGAFLVLPLLRKLLLPIVLPDINIVAGLWDLRTLGVLVFLIALAALLSGAIPAAIASRGDLSRAIKSGVKESGPAQGRLKASLAAFQVGLTLALLSGAGLFARSLDEALHLDLGIEPDRVLVATADLERAGMEPRRVDEIYRQAMERTRKLAGVERVALAATIPFESSVASDLSVPGLPELPEMPTGGPYINAVSEDFFAATGTKLLRGRVFTPQDQADSARVTVVNATMARTLWPTRQPLGACMKIGGEDSPCALVVGVVEDARREQLEEEPTLQFYVPLNQAPADLTSRALFVRTAGAPSNLAGAVGREFRAVAEDLPYVDVKLLADLLAPQLRPWRAGAIIFILFGALALALALVGLYGVIAHSLASRTYELGVRAALGAQWRDLQWLAVRQGLVVAAGGAVVGLGLILMAEEYLQPLLFHVSALDPWVHVPATLGVIAAALAASYAPSRRVRRLDPAAVLRAGENQELRLT